MSETDLTVSDSVYNLFSAVDEELAETRWHKPSVNHFPPPEMSAFLKCIYVCRCTVTLEVPVLEHFGVEKVSATRERLERHALVVPRGAW